MRRWIGLALCCSTASLLASPLYTIERLPGISAYKVSETGYVTGYGWNGTATGGYLYRNGDVQWLPQLREVTIPRAVNSFGHVAGGAWNGQPGYDGVAFVYRDGEYDILPAPGNFAEALILNDLGWVHGYYSLDNAGHFDSFLYRDGRMETGVHLNDFNNRGQFAPQRLPSPSIVFGNAINEKGSLAGNFEGHPALYRNGTLLKLGLIPGQPEFIDYATNDLNDYDHVVGAYAPVEHPNDYRGFLWRDGILYDLTKLVDSPGFFFHWASGINNAGQILGGATLNGVEVSVLLTPVPEPETGLLIAMGTLFVLAYRKYCEKVPKALGRLG